MKRENCCVVRSLHNPPLNSSDRQSRATPEPNPLFLNQGKMILSHLLPPFLALLFAAPALSQNIVYDAEHNATVITGTWSSGSQAVKTGAGFANPANQSFTYPRVTGVSYSFTDDGFYEIARYRFNGNGSEPTCITGVIGWVHGHYTLQPNGSITMVPLGDGYQQIQDPCAAVSNFIENYNITELYQSWRIFQDPQTSAYKLHLFQFDGAPLAPQFQVSTTPIMLPTQLLRNVTPPDPAQAGDGPGGLQTQNLLVNANWAERTAGLSAGVLVGAMGLASLLL